MKRIICVLSMLALLLGVAAVSASADTVLYGDVNGDGVLNNRDLGILQRYLNQWDVECDTAVADVNDDGKINNRDLGLLQQYLNGWDVTLGPAPVEPDPDTPVDPDPDTPVDPDVPVAALPEVGYDLDGRERIFVDAVKQEGNVVTITIANHSNKFMTEETCYVRYTCTDADGNVLTLPDTYYGYIYFGMLEVGWSKTFTITLPEGTAKLELGDYRIVYWTQWA